MSQAAGETSEAKAPEKVLEKTTARNTSAAKKTTPKKTAPKKPALKKMTMAEMQAALKSLDTRMKRADSLTRKSVKTLEGVVETLDERTLKDNDTHKYELSQRVGRLSSELENGLATTRREIKTALASALSNPNSSAVETAVAQAMSRLNETETHQARAIAKINRHLANLAKAVEERIVSDQVTAAEALNQVESQLSQKIHAVEKDTAIAFGTIGDKITSLSDVFDKNQSNTKAVIAEKISELTAQTQAELDKQANAVEARLKAFEVSEREAALIRPDALSTEMTANVSALSGQIETLQARLDEVDMNMSALQAQTDVMGHDLVQTQTTLTHLQAREQTPPPYADRTPPAPMPAPQAPTPLPQPKPAASNIVTLVPAQPMPSHAAPQSTPYPSLSSAAHSETASHQPVEFDPSAYYAGIQSTQPNMPHMLQQSAATAFAQPAFASERLPLEDLLPLEEELPFTPPTLTPAAQYADVDSMPTGAPLLPYADPAYAEGSTDLMNTMRIADTGKSKKRRKIKAPKTPKAPKALKSEASENTFLTARNLRVAALATGLTLATLFLAKAFMNSQTDAPLNLSGSPQLPGAQQPLNPETIAPNEQQATATAPIGTYEDIAAPNIDASQTDTLEAAAQSGDAIAQFQLGLSYLEQDRTQDGVSLIRNASQTLPAAQYRLAKIYESGLGVEKDTSLARELTERAARAGNRIAMHDLAIFYAYGNGGVPVNMSVAAGWFEKAAERGVVDSQFNLAILYENGQGVTPSLPDAYFWYSIAGAQGDQTAAARISALEETMPPVDIESAKTRIKNFTPVKINPEANGIFKDLPWSKQNNVAAQSRAELKDVQTLLADLGFNIGAPDGLMGSKTREAIIGFQQANGLSETGQVSAALIERLETAARA